MSIKLTNHLEGNFYQHKEFVLEQLANATGLPNVQGILYTNTTDKGFYYYDGSAWKRIDNQSMTASAILAALTGMTTQPLTGLDADKLDGQEGSHYLNRSNHSGNQAASTISDLATVVKAYRLDEFAVPTADINLNDRKITNLANPTSTTSSDAVPASWVTNAINNAVQGLDIKNSVRAILLPHPTNAEGRHPSTLFTYSTTAPYTMGKIEFVGDNTANQSLFDNVSLAVGNRVIINNANDDKDNGFYEVVAITPNLEMKRVDLLHGQQFGTNINAFAFVERGSVYGDTGWVLRSPNFSNFVVGTDEMKFVQFSSAGVVEAGNGIEKNGNVISVDTSVVARKYSTSIGNTTGGTVVTFTITHNLNTEDVYVSVREASGAKEFVLADTAVTGVNTITVTFADPPSANQYRVTVIG